MFTWFSYYQFDSYNVRLGDQQPFQIGSPIQVFCYTYEGLIFYTSLISIIFI